MYLKKVYIIKFFIFILKYVKIIMSKNPKTFDTFPKIKKLYFKNDILRKYALSFY